jgi:hypothetical protein
MGRIIWGGIVGGVILFVWGFTIHVLTPLGHMGVSPLPGVDGVKTAFAAADVETGMYMIPHAYPGDTEEEQARWKEEYSAGPRALIIYTPDGDDPMSPMQMGIGLLINIASALVAALIVSQVAAFYGARLLVVALLGLFAWLAVEVPYWNWFLFPADRIAGSFIEHVGGWFVAGLAMAGIVKGRLR